MDVSGGAMVTGASRGLGRAVALELARRGFNVTAAMRDPADGASLHADGAGFPGGVFVTQVDVTNPASIKVPDDVRVVVNNAGVEDVNNLPVEDTQLDVWRRLFETNLFGVVSVVQRAIPVLRRNGGGVIVNVTSSAVLRPLPFLAAYRASKAAVSALGESLRAEVEQFGIRIVEIMPGPIETDMLAAGERPPSALALEPYHDLAAAGWARRQAHRGGYTLPATAAGLVVDAILDDGGPLRYGCDPLGAAALAAWRDTPDDETWMRAAIEQYKGFAI
jgi:NAD(P)-dependent dehydrogenase (short-subunit alcohol dehydrogenase family)